MAVMHGTSVQVTDMIGIGDPEGPSTVSMRPCSSPCKDDDDGGEGGDDIASRVGVPAQICCKAASAQHARGKEEK
jgi:hypothetical protein